MNYIVYGILGALLLVHVAVAATATVVVLRDRTLERFQISVYFRQERVIQTGLVDNLENAEFVSYRDLQRMYSEFFRDGLRIRSLRDTWQSTAVSRGASRALTVRQISWWNSLQKLPKFC